MKGLGNPWEASQGSRICIASAIGSEQIIVLRVPANQTRPERQDNRRIDIGAMDECELGRRWLKPSGRLAMAGIRLSIQKENGA
jgi:hypothetical protein